jgi:hypothetical protein
MIEHFKNSLSALVIILLLSLVYTLASCGDADARYRNAPRRHYSFPIRPPHTKAPPLVQGAVTTGVIVFGLSNSATTKEKSKHEIHLGE